MKKYSFLSVILLVAIGICILISCGDDNPVSNPPTPSDGNEQTEIISSQDPEGTVVVNMQKGSTNTFVEIGLGVPICINEANNFVGYNSNVEFVSVGRVNGLSGVNSIPTSGWETSIAVIPETGYVVRYRSSSNLPYIHARLYVVKNALNNSGVVTGAIVKYQSPFEALPISINETSLEFSFEANSKTLTMEHLVAVTIVEKPEWCTVNQNGKEIIVTVTKNTTDQQRQGIIVLKNNVNSVTITIVQKALDLTVLANEYATNYFSIEGGQYRQGTMPVSSSGAQALGNVTMNDRALANGANFINIATSQSIQTFLIGIQNVDGYIEVPAVSRATQSYSIPIIYGSNYHSDMTTVVKGVTTDGRVTLPFSQVVRFVESATGDLHINLTFDNAKDIDLHLVTPNGHRIYYADRTITTTIGTGTISGGLDHDTNAACSLDNLNNENIVLPAALIEPGVYLVQINMWQNCTPSVSTNWTITARYNGASLTNTLTLPTASENEMRVQNKDTDIHGSNPVYGCYPVNSPSNRDSGYTTVMKFKILNTGAAPVITRTYKRTDIDNMKLEEGSWHSPWKR